MWPTTTICLLIILLIVVTSLCFNKSTEMLNKSNSFECGFNPLNNPNPSFNLPFFYVVLMFLIFEMELALIVFYPLMPTHLLTSTLTVVALIFIVTIYEWEKNLINWF